MKKLFKSFKNIVLFILLFFVVLFIAGTIAGSVVFCITKNDHAVIESQFESQSQYVEEYQYYHKNEINIDDCNPIFQNVYDNLPDHLEQIIRDNWIIIVSNKEPFDINTAVDPAGCTYSKYRVIWLGTGFDEEVLCHEIGHALDIYFGNKSETSAFYYFYEKYWNSYHEYERVDVDKHSTSTSSEFFAALFTDYIMHTEYIDEYCPEAVVYFSNLFQDDISCSGIGEYLYFLEGLNNKLFSMLSEIRIHKKLSHVINGVHKNVKNNPVVNVNDHAPVINYAWMNPYSEEITDIIIDMTLNPDNYPVEKYASSRGYIVRYDFPWDISYYNEVLSFTSIYFGEENFDPIDVNVVNGTETVVVIKKDDILAAEKNRIELLKNIEEALASIHIGTETEMLIQISAFITDKMEYGVVNNATSKDFWDGQPGDCVSYAMIFKQFCDRLGITCDIIYQRNTFDEGHVYNRVKLSDGTFKYYDLSQNIVDSKPLKDSGYHINNWMS